MNLRASCDLGVNLRRFLLVHNTTIETNPMPLSV
jgi:hypothetical protein